MQVRFLAPLAVAAIATGADAAVTVTVREDLTIAGINVSRRPDANSSVKTIEDSVGSDVDSFSGLTPLTNSISSSTSDTRNDDATNTTLVVGGTAAVSATSTLSYSGGNLSTYTITGRYEANVTTGTLEGYRPNDAPAGQVTVVDVTPVYNSVIALVVDAATPFSISVAQSNTTGNAANAGLIYRDNNNDGNQNAGDDEIVPYFVVGGVDTLTRTGTLAPNTAANPYRIAFFGNLIESTTADGVTINSSADYTSTFSVAVPEPASLAAATLLGAGLLRRRRR